MSEKKFGNDYSADIQINRFQLEQECEKQPSLYYYYADLLAGLKSDRDDLKDKIKVAMAGLEMAVRSDPEVFMGATKVTEATFKAYMDSGDALKRKAYTHIQEWVDELKKIAEKIYHLEAVVDSLAHRKSELDNLVQLWIKGYYAAPDGGKPTATDQASRGIREQMKANKDKVEDKI